MRDKVTAPGLVAMKARGEKIVVLTAYDSTSGALADAAGVDAVLVGDSVGNTMLGYSSTLPVTLGDMVHHVGATSRAVHRALLIADMPYGSYGANVAQAVESSVALVRAGAEAVKLEGEYLDEVRAIVKSGVPVMGHLGFTPQSVNVFGGHKVQGRSEGNRIVEAAKHLQDAGVFSIVLELVPADLAAQVTSAVSVPTIGIGAGAGCNGQVQVFHDVLGLSERDFKHAKRYADGRGIFVAALEAYAHEVRGGEFPTAENSF